MAIPPVMEKEKLPGWHLMKPVQDRAKNLAGDCKQLVIIGSSMRDTDQVLWDILEASTGEIWFVGDEDAYGKLKSRHPGALYVGETLQQAVLTT